MTETREVCKMCFNSSSHKPNPVLTPFSKSSYDVSTGEQKCPVCRLEWAPIRIYKDHSQRWVKIRPRPKIPATIDFQMCNNANGKCTKGHECSFAHSQAELASWNRERQNEPRPAPQIPGPYQFQLCKHMQNTGTCPYGQRCTFAHSEEELSRWLRDLAGHVPNGNYMQAPSGHMYANAVGGVTSTEFRCEICDMNCSSRRQLVDHMSGSKHKQMLTARTVHAVNNPNPVHLGASRGGGAGGRIRRRPHLSFPINGYKMCMHVHSHRRCIYGEYCTFAHSQEEYDEWNRQLAIANAPKATNILRFQQTAQAGVSNGGRVGGAMGGASNTGGSGGGSYDLDDFVDEAVIEEKQDFAYLVRSKLASEHKRTSTVSGFEDARNGVSVTEISGRPLSLLWSTSSAIEWVFEIAIEVPSALNSIVLFDTLSLDFEISEAIIINYGGQMRSLTSQATPKEGVAWQLNQRLAPPEKIRVKVKLVPRSGLLGQLVIFDFESFVLVRGLSVHVLTEQELRLSEVSESRKKSRPPKPDLYWEQHFTTIPLEDQYLEEADHYLPAYQLPEQVEKLLEMGKYENVENRVTKDNYKRRMHNLLYLEEYERRKCMSRYDLYNVEIVTHEYFTGPDGSMNRAPPGYYFIKLSLGEMLCEGQYDIRPSATGKALLLPLNQQVAHECFIEHVGKDSVILKLTAKSKQACAVSQNRCSVRFLPSSRVAMRAMHFAVDHLDLSTIFPTPDSSISTMDNPSALKKCLEELRRSELNKAQQDAITSMLDPLCRKIPSLVLGPFGCGKTRTLKECIKLLCLHFPETRILICTHTNSAADLYVEGMHEEWTRQNRGRPPLLRILFSLRKYRSVPPTIREYCKMEGDKWVIPPLAELKKCKMIVATLSTARNLLFTGLPKDHFTHIFIDEAAQALEPESIIPLVMANPLSKIVLAGDHMQLDPPVYSPLAHKYNLHLSLLERLYDHEIYDSGVGQLCKTLLTENHRSHHLILSLPSKLFYKNKLTCKAVLPEGPQGLPAIKFVGVEGHEEQYESSPSFYNSHEATEVAKQVHLMVKKGVPAKQICVLSYYNAQIQRIRYLLRQRQYGLAEVAVHSIENVQGREFRALILSTVRTCSNEPQSDEDGGFLTNAKLFNTAVTRAKQWLVVVGEPITLCTVGSNRLLWGEYIKNCQQDGVFEYQNAEKFESCLEDKIVVRQVLEKVYSEFYGKLKHQKVISNGKEPHPLSSQQPQASSSNTPLNYFQAPPQLRTQILRSKVKEAAQTGDEATVAKITEDLSKLSVEQQAYLLKDAKLFTSKVQEMEHVFRRAGPTAAIMNTSRMQAPLLSQPAPAINPASGVAALMSDLPPFLQSMMGALMTYLHWCEGNLRTNAFIANSPEMRENITKQRTKIQQQIGLVNEQIQLYRDLVKRMKAYQAQVAAAGMAQTQPTPGSMGGVNAIRTMGGMMTNAMVGGQFVPQSQPVYSGQPQQLPPTAHAQMKPQQFHPSMHAAPDHQHQRQVPMMTNQQFQAPPPQAPPNSTHFQPQQQQPRMQPPQHHPPAAPPSTTSFMPQAMTQPPGPSHFPQAFPSAHPMTQPPQHFPSALPPISAGHPAFQQPLQGEGMHPGQSRMMSQAAAGAHGSSAFSYGLSAHLPNSQEQHFNQQNPPAAQQPNQLSVQTSVTGLTGTTKNLSPLDAAINESSNRSSPAVARRPVENSELYVSDDELFT